MPLHVFISFKAAVTIRTNNSHTLLVRIFMAFKMLFQGKLSFTEITLECSDSSIIVSKYVPIMIGLLCVDFPTYLTFKLLLGCSFMGSFMIFKFNNCFEYFKTFSAFINNFLMILIFMLTQKILT